MRCRIRLLLTGHGARLPSIRPLSCRSADVTKNWLYRSIVRSVRSLPLAIVYNESTIRVLYYGCALGPVLCIVLLCSFGPSSVVSCALNQKLSELGLLSHWSLVNVWWFLLSWDQWCKCCFKRLFPTSTAFLSSDLRSPNSNVRSKAIS